MLCPFFWGFLFFLGRFLSGRAFSLRHTGGTRVYPYRILRHHACCLFPSHKLGGLSSDLFDGYAELVMHVFSRYSIRDRATWVLQRHSDAVTKTDVDDHYCICSYLRELNSSVLRRSALDGAATGTLWLSILSSCGLSKLLLRPTTYSWRSVWRVPVMTAVSFQDTHWPTKWRHITLFPSFSSAWRLPRHTDCSQPESLPLPWCGWPEVKSLPLLCLCSSFPFWHLCRCRNFYLPDGLPTDSQVLPSCFFGYCLVLSYCGIYHNTILLFPISFYSF